MLDIKNLKVGFPVGSGRNKATLMAVNGVTLSVGRGEAMGIVGESGSGKSTVGRTLLHLNHSSGGNFYLDGEDITTINSKQEKQLRKKAQMIFQDPHSALNPRMTIMRSVAEPLILHTKVRGAELREKVGELLEIVGLQKQFLYRYPHELSGGQKQRVCIARAIALNPELLVLDEPTSALDVSVQAQILEFLKKLQKDRQLTYLFISHNLAVVRYMCSQVAVMYLGQIVEQGSTEEIFNNPRHPYTQALLEAVPLPEAGQPRRSHPLVGDIPSPLSPPPGCAFNSRCQQAIDGVCGKILPENQDIADGHVVKCHLYEGGAIPKMPVAMSGAD
ncbi:ATP-binding cassette domain-containing protein [Sneathiella sp. P13V-1]|uniref:ABC transporter ATP-binding protein n=1 Tax=Sneathiella sp. P13V-1 TaxID=2697366 RepID=UPI00187BAFFB|nr:ABC transporter ATP-binding protein [Sneathiella sp. P13V-1]MBE7637090.1 ATP-binding cassette domain-containing protein [Sneathiella sp. P13V-1]